MNIRRFRRRPLARTLWSLAVLGLLRERPMHPYEMERQLRFRHLDQLLGLKRGSLYHAIRELERAALIEPVETSREGRRPERTVYQVTPTGDEELTLWVRELLSTPAPEPSHFMAALAHMRKLAPQDAAEQLQQRCINLEVGIAGLQAVERTVGQLVDRAAIIEVEYRRSLVQAELAWVQAVLDDLRSGRFSWDTDTVPDQPLL
jgi:DNA-binding PadR family transcriptional regulator